MAKSRQNKPFHLFVYGTLRHPSVFRAVLGLRMVNSAADDDGVESFFARDAVLDGYKKISPDNTYLYAVPDPQGRIHGLVVGPLPGECMSPLLKYEGRNYARRTLKVLTSDEQVRATVFVGNIDQLKHSFGYAFQDPLKQEILLEEKIEKALLETEREKLQAEDEVGRRALGELHGATIRDIRRRHFEAGGISDYAIRRSIKDRPLPDFMRVARDPEARALAPNYLSMVIRQVIFNEIEEKVYRDFRYELDRMQSGEQFHERAMSSLTALRMLNNAPVLLDMIVADCLTDLQFPRDRLVDFVRWAVVAADAFYDPRSASREIRFLRTHMAGGYVPMGVELEFSNIGHRVITDPQGRDVQDPDYDSFLFFRDFALDVLTWKLGGHVDDHREKSSITPRRGFFEVALGNVSIEANLSKPITQDPWVLNQFIHQARRFFHIAPHSVHISLQLRSRHRPVRDRLPPLSVMKCLFAIGGDPLRTKDGGVRIGRLTGEEITEDTTDDGGPKHMLFSDISLRHPRDTDEMSSEVGSRRAQGRYVQQFKFLRLSPTLFYEPIAAALKGLQISARPGSFLTPSQYESSPEHRRRYEKLLAWGRRPSPLNEREMEIFLRHVYRGLMTERRGKPAHTEAYIAWALSELRDMLRQFNRMVTSGSPAPAVPPR